MYSCICTMRPCLSPRDDGGVIPDAGRRLFRWWCRGNWGSWRDAFSASQSSLYRFLHCCECVIWICIYRCYDLHFYISTLFWSFDSSDHYFILTFVFSGMTAPDLPLKKQPIYSCGKEREPKNTLSYNLSVLKWDARHQENEQKMYCYCGKFGDW